jgi:hypothetical protein
MFQRLYKAILNFIPFPRKALIPMSDRYPAIAPEDLKPDQKILHDHITTEVNQYFNGM